MGQLSKLYRTAYSVGSEGTITDSYDVMNSLSSHVVCGLHSFHIACKNEHHAIATASHQKHATLVSSVKFNYN